MVNKIEWSLNAVNQVEGILEFLTKEVSENAAAKFLETVLSKVKSLEHNTYEGRPVPNMRTVRFVIFEKHHRLYYRRHGRTLFITNVYDTRQNPDKRPYFKK